MPSAVPIEMFLGSVSVIGVLTAYVWNGLHARIQEIEKEQAACPFSDIKQDLAAIKNDIKWLKNFIIKS